MWTTIKTVLESATLLSVVTYFLQKYLVEPRQAIEQAISDIDVDLIYYANVWANPGVPRREIVDAAQSAFRRHAASLRSKLRKLGHLQCAVLFGLPSVANLAAASKELIGLSNSVGTPAVGSVPEEALANVERVKQLRSMLQIPEGIE